MKKRNVRKDDSASVQKPTKLQQQKKEKTPTSWKKIILLSLGAVAMLGFSVKILPELIQQAVFMYRLRLPYFADLSQPADFSLNHTINLYLSPEEGISLGVWLTVPDLRWKEAQGKDLDWYEKALGDGNPVFIYFHGNTKNRAAPHRIGVLKVLSALGYHVVVPDYRGFGDSTGEITEEGATTDSLYVYNWVKARSGSSLVVIWGHSLGTALSTNVAVKLLEKGVVLDGVILEGTFNAARSKIPVNPLIWFYFTLPGIKYLFIGEGSLLQSPPFPTEENLKKMKSPILFLHAEDDSSVPIETAETLYEIAASFQNKDRVKMVRFDGTLKGGYLHNGLYRDAELPGVIKDFVASL
ncbi:monoacylglycerol lipase ABHD12-like [Boleophthalmus pectinirostris]|uniref:monoacylglycerol lipase ABHD12-like n=1 Tax=Boleophthalmus pectinirostris TaxID=150288 RepID=UPI000A1C529F|nr:monoacylglycerol lipase ABHD12-like [Boleophthalmus pectinirostris]